MKTIINWLDDRLGLSTNLKPIIEHPVPPTGWDYTIGSATLIAFTVQVVTGVALAFTYVPTPDHAYESLEFITHGAVLGNIVRGIHYWGASAMVLLACAHAAQVFLIGAFKYPREVNWRAGAELFLCPCHGGVYYADGSVAGGPPPRPLVRYSVRIGDSQRVQVLTRPLQQTIGQG